ncbi:hypothetical protein [Vreelandella titanicae]|uniref:hypothetical protein n=1 Tax=Vreelandella titanicae TaxID=664683 RepID=UPI003FD6ECD4
MTKRAEAVGKKKQEEKRQRLLANIWGEELSSTPVWNRHENDGYSTVPRVLPHIGRLLDRLAGKGTPVAPTYFALWCRVRDEGCLEIRDKEDLAYEAGFSGQRAIYSLSQRIRKLQELGFIKTKQKGNNEFQYIMIVNPLSVLLNKRDEIDPAGFQTLCIRMEEISAKWPEVKNEND